MALYINVFHIKDSATKGDCNNITSFSNLREASLDITRFERGASIGKGMCTTIDGKVYRYTGTIILNNGKVRYINLRWKNLLTNPIVSPGTANHKKVFNK